MENTQDNQRGDSFSRLLAALQDEYDNVEPVESYQHWGIAARPAYRDGCRDGQRIGLYRAILILKASSEANETSSAAARAEIVRRLKRYCRGRREVIEASIACERLAGNAPKEMAERTALAEITGFEIWMASGGLSQNDSSSAAAPGGKDADVR